MTLTQHPAANLLNQRLQLDDRRWIGYDTYGPPNAPAVLYLHGAPGSRVEYRIADDGRIAQQAGVRVIAVDRPGIGLTSPSSASCVTDVAALADHLRLTRFALLGFSGGAPAALTIAAALPDRVSTVALVSAVAPHDIAGITDDLNPDTLRFLTLVRTRPRIARLMLTQMRLFARFAPGLLVAQMMRTMPAADQLVLRDPARGRAMAASLTEAMRHGTAGVLTDLQNMIGRWDDSMSHVQAPVLMWHGDADQNAPMAMAYWLKPRLNAQHLHVRPRAGHISTLVDNLSDVLSTLRNA